MVVALPLRYSQNKSELSKEAALCSGVAGVGIVFYYHQLYTGTSSCR